MYNKKMYELGSRRSVIRELFEYGKKRADELGKDAVFDFSIGNPSVSPPKEINATIKNILKGEEQNSIHGYTSAQGNASTRQAIVQSIERKHSFSFPIENIYITSGAAAALTISLKALTNINDEFIVFAPFFPEYKVFIEAVPAKAVIVPFIKETLEPDLEKFSKAINKNTKGLIFNSPNNPSGLVYSKKTIENIISIIKHKNAELGIDIVVIVDEPYRELVYDNAFVPYIPNYYDNTIVTYSFSKSLSLPGQRIGYIAVSPNHKDDKKIAAAVAGAGRVQGYVCASSLFQRVIEQCIDAKTNIDAYKKNRDLLYESLTAIGYKCIKPQGAFYLFFEALEENANSFSDKAKDFGLLLVPGDDFYAPGYVRLAYCVDYDMIKRSIPAFEKLYRTYYNS